jgi:hypothetical protein
MFYKELNPSVVLFDRFMIEEQFGWRVAETVDAYDWIQKIYIA